MKLIYKSRSAECFLLDCGARESQKEACDNLNRATIAWEFLRSARHYTASWLGENERKAVGSSAALQQKDFITEKRKNQSPPALEFLMPIP